MKTEKDKFEKLAGSLFNSLKVNEMSKIKGGNAAARLTASAPCQRTGTDYIDCADND